MAPVITDTADADGRQLPGIDAVKFTKRDLCEELSNEAAKQPYESPHSFGKTYLEHRQALELSIQDHRELELYAHAKGLFFIETLCSPGCMGLLDSVSVDAVKIASRDVTNIPLLKALRQVPQPIILSSGMADLREMKNAIAILTEEKSENEVAILHCLSQYPAEYQHLNLRVIGRLQEVFPGHTIGYSDHSIGVSMPVAARVLGAAIIEKHITLNRQMKGSDHHCSLEPEGLWRFARDVRNTERALGSEEKILQPCVRSAREKLGRSLALQVSLARGEVLRESYLGMRSPGTGLSWEEKALIVGREALRDLPANALLRREDFG